MEPSPEAIEVESGFFDVDGSTTTMVVSRKSCVDAERRGADNTIRIQWARA